MAYFVVAEGLGFLAEPAVEGPFDDDCAARQKAREKQRTSYHLFAQFMQTSFHKTIEDEMELEQTYHQLHTTPDPSIPQPVVYRVLNEEDLI